MLEIVTVCSASSVAPTTPLHHGEEERPEQTSEANPKADKRRRCEGGFGAEEEHPPYRDARKSRSSSRSSSSRQQRRKRRPHPPVFVNLREGIANSRGSSNSSGLFLSTRTSGSDKMALQALMPAYLVSLLPARRHLRRLHKIQLKYLTGVL